MAFRTAAADAQDALAELLGDVLPDDVTCSVGYPDGGPGEKSVWVATNIDAQLPRRISGHGQRDEENVILVRCLVDMTNLGGAEGRDAALELAGYVEDVVEGDPTLDGAVQEAHVSALRGQEGIPDELRREYGVEVVVSYYATAARG